MRLVGLETLSPRQQITLIEHLEQSVGNFDYLCPSCRQDTLFVHCTTSHGNINIRIRCESTQCSTFVSNGPVVGWTLIEDTSLPSV